MKRRVRTKTTRSKRQTKALARRGYRVVAAVPRSSFGYPGLMHHSVEYVLVKEQ